MEENNMEMTGYNKKIDLSSYGYDIVTAVTKKTIDAFFFNLLRKRSFPQMSKYYLWKKDSGCNFYIDEATEEETEGISRFHLFDIPSRASKRTEEQKNRIKEAFAAYPIACMFQCIPFISSKWLERHLPSDLIHLNGLDQKLNVAVQFPLDDMIIICANPSGADSFNIYLESESDYGSWNYMVLGCLEGSYLDSDTMFSLTHLMNNFVLDSVRLDEWDPVKPDQPQYFIYLDFIFDCFKQVFKSEKSAFTQGIRLDMAKPTDLKFSMTKHSDLHPELETLNYIVMCDNHVMPPIKPFNWIWVNENEAKYTHGVMAVSQNYNYKMAARLYDYSIRQMLIAACPSVYEKFGILYMRVKYDKAPVGLIEFGSKGLYKYFEEKSIQRNFQGHNIDFSAAYHNDIALQYYIREGSPIIVYEFVAHIHVDLDIKSVGEAKGTVYDLNVKAQFIGKPDKSGSYTFKAIISTSPNAPADPFKADDDFLNYLSKGNREQIINILLTDTNKYMNEIVNNMCGAFKVDYSNKDLHFPAKSSFHISTGGLSSGKDAVFNAYYPGAQTLEDQQ